MFFVPNLRIINIFPSKAYPIGTKIMEWVADKVPINKTFY
ncbi:hypothetical protein THER_1007 [Thermodesulfovibrio sp. N1]|nr:hypothetical protein THER_1007 [Thermodesulfovibrio sp. N1]